MSERLVKSLDLSQTQSCVVFSCHPRPFLLPSSARLIWQLLRYHVHPFAKWLSSSSLLLASFHLICCLNISISVGLHVLNTITFNSFSLPGVCKPKLPFPSVLLRGAWCLRTAQGRKCLDTRLSCLVSWFQGTQVAENAFLPYSNQASSSQTPACGLTPAFWPLYVHGFSCCSLRGIWWEQNLFASTKTIFVCNKV